VTPLLEAAQQIQELCEEKRWDFCVIGGLAVQRWGEPRLTRDVDLTILAGFGDPQPFVDALLERFQSRLDEPAEFARRNRVLLLRSAAGIGIDVALGGLPFEERSVRRSSNWAVTESERLRTCSAEDLVVHKVFAGRDRDWADVRGIVARQASSLDVALVVDELRPLLEAKGDGGALDKLRAILG
jgi:hypothetical protein